MHRLPVEILVPVDGSEGAEAGLQAACRGHGLRSAFIVSCLSIALSVTTACLAATVPEIETLRAYAVRTWERSLRPRLAPFLTANFPDGAERWQLRVDGPRAVPPGDHELVLDEARIDRMRRFGDALAYAAADTTTANRLKAYARVLRAESGVARAETAADFAAFAAIDRAAFDRTLAEPALERVRTVLRRDAIEAAIAQELARRLLTDGADSDVSQREIDALAFTMIVASRPESSRGLFPGFMVAAMFDEPSDELGSAAYSCRMQAVLRHERDAGGAPTGKRPAADAAPGREAAALVTFIEPPVPPGCDLSWPTLPARRRAP